jgi:WD40 repeat protein
MLTVLVCCRTPFLKLDGHSKGVFDSAWSSKFKFIASGGADKNVCVFNPFSGTRQAVMQGHTATVTHVVVNDDDHQIISLGMVCI